MSNFIRSAKMYKILIKNNIDKTYDKIFKIIDNHTTFFKVNAENEYKTNEGYVIEFREVPSSAINEITQLKNVEEI
jgi:hypothetical protein